MKKLIIDKKAQLQEDVKNHPERYCALSSRQKKQIAEGKITTTEERKKQLREKVIDNQL